MLSCFTFTEYCCHPIMMWAPEWNEKKTLATNRMIKLTYLGQMKSDVISQMNWPNFHIFHMYEIVYLIRKLYRRNKQPVCFANSEWRGVYQYVFLSRMHSPLWKIIRTFAATWRLDTKARNCTKHWSVPTTVRGFESTTVLYRISFV